MTEQPLSRVFADLHIHIGSTSRGEAVKISGSRDLTFSRIAQEAVHRKGIGLLGIIDCHSPGVQADIAHCLETGEMAEIAGGGIRYRDTTILLGSEIEVKEPDRGAAHYLAFLPTFALMRDFTSWMSRHMRNVQLSSQRIYVSTRELQREVKARGGLFIPAHVFTPHKSLYGSCTDDMSDVLDPGEVDAVELGLSADSAMAGLIPELDGLQFVTNSDAHSLAKIGREYNELRLAEPSFRELALALKKREGRHIAANYGLNPLLGKYHRTYCLNCGSLAEEERSTERCAQCGSVKLTRGVMDRIEELGAHQGRTEAYMPEDRPPYVYQVPLEFVPGIGKAAMAKLLDRFGTEMNILHDAPEEEIAKTVPAKTAEMIARARAGKLALDAGGGGRYGRVAKSGKDA
ncbi:endonuclease Q family protein [Paenibacillus xanthanilyticus]|uniref:Endonuclease Q family protein n=1 Tax=Paenibacillus xanthanilyticus TaxID=1783531 RepID=A0ABV8KD30_9BACL